MSPARGQVVNRPYQVLAELKDHCGGYRYLADCAPRGVWAVRGVYFFFDHGESPRAGTGHPRVVRVGTHALTFASCKRRLKAVARVT